MPRLHSETSDFMTDPYTSADPYTSRWTRLESRRPSPIGIVMDSDGDDDERSVSSTPVRLQSDSFSETQPHRKTKSLDDCSILDSLSDIIVSSDDYEANMANISPIAMPTLHRKMEPPSKMQKRLSSLPLLPNDSPSSNAPSPDHYNALSPDITLERVERDHPETPPARNKPETKNSFWNRSPIAKGVKEAIWSTKRSGTPTRSGAPATPTRAETQARRGLISTPLLTPTRNDMSARRSLANGGRPSTPDRAEFPAVRRGSFNNIPSSTPTNRSELPANRRSATPTRLEMMGRRIPTPMRGEQGPRRSASPVSRAFMKSSSEESQGDSRRSLRSRSASFSTAQESIEEEVHYEFRAQRIGKLGLVINSSPQTGPMVEQVKDYSTLFGRILAGDRIIEVDGLETSNMSIKEVTKRLAGKYGIRSNSGEVRIKVARIRERHWNDDDRRSVNSDGSGAADSVDSFYSSHRRNHSDPEPILTRLALNSISEHHRLASYSQSNHSKSGEEV